MYLAFIIGILGLIIGSFLNVVIFRVPHDQSIVAPRSHCPVCGTFLRPWELIPVVSFIMQRRRCRTCHALISWRYPLVELLTGLLFAYSAWQSVLPDVHLLLRLVFIAFIIALAFIDYDTMRLPDKLTIPLLGVGIINAFLGGIHTGLVSLLTALGAGGLFWLIAIVYPRGMGLGDVKFVAALGAFLSFPSILLAIFLASLAGSVLGIALLLVHKSGFRQQMPFGPYLGLGAVVALLWGNQILAFYWSFFLH